MATTDVRYRRPLNNEQFRVLRFLYWYRFATCRHITTYLHKPNHKVVQKKLQILEDQAYIAKRYDKTYKLKGCPAEYYITPTGARLLRALTPRDAYESDKVTDQGIKSLYKLPTVTESFRDHCLNVLSVALRVLQLYPESIIPFTRIRLFAYPYFPVWTPDVVLLWKPPTTTQRIPMNFFLDVWDGTRPFFVGAKKARNYLRYINEGGWPKEFPVLPVMLAICATESAAAKLNAHICKGLGRSFNTVTFATTTIQKFLASESALDKIWERIDEEGDEFSVFCSLAELAQWSADHPSYTEELPRPHPNPAPQSFRTVE